MRVIAVILLMLFSVLQSMIVWYWSQTEAIEQFRSVFIAFNGSVPAWSETAFYIGSGWMAAPLLIGIFLVAAIFNKDIRTYLGHVSIIAFIVTILMVYSMYPLHIMLAVGS